jgi:GTP-binding nuclear protein Ran
MQDKIQEFNIVLIGDRGVGKTSFIKRFVSGEYDKENRTLTENVELHPLMFHTNRGYVQMNCYDTHNQERFGNPSKYYQVCDGAIIMFDLTSRITYKNLPQWYQDVTRCRTNIPVVVCGNKIDISDRKVRDITFPNKKDLPYFEISVSSSKNLVSPFLCLLRKLLKDESVHFAEEFLTAMEQEAEDVEMRDIMEVEIEEESADIFVTRQGSEGKTAALIKADKRTEGEAAAQEQEVASGSKKLTPGEIRIQKGTFMLLI